jgi:hypothetical protein
MTKTSKVAAVHDGVQGFRIECDCKTHAGHGNAAFVPFDVATDRIHGWVTNANHPARPIQQFHAKKGVFAL